MAVKVIERKPGHIDLQCECGKPIVITNQYGMFCEDRCFEKESIETKTKAENLIKDLIDNLFMEK